MKRTYEMFFEDIYTSLEKIKKYISGMSFSEFIHDDKTIDAVIRNLEILGEASKNIPENLRQEHSNIPWKRMIGLRNIIAHEYFGIDYQILWQIVKKDLPKLEPLIKESLNKLTKEN